MVKIRLELDFIEIHRKRKKWNVYFILATENPEDAGQTVLSVFPQHPIKFSRKGDNRHDFKPQGSGDANRMFILERNMPVDESVRARIWIVQSRDKTRSVGDVMQEVGKSTEASQVSEKVLTALGAATPWIGVGKSILSMSKIIGKFLSEAKDTKKGFVNMDESFTEEEINLGELDRFNQLGDFGEIGWTWVIDK